MLYLLNLLLNSYIYYCYLLDKNIFIDNGLITNIWIISDNGII